MSAGVAVWLVLCLALLFANLPFLSQRLLLVWRLPEVKGLGWRLLELLVYYLLVGGVGLGLEQYQGQIYPQNWEFYATTATLFLTLAFPGFVYRYLFQPKHAGD